MNAPLNQPKAPRRIRFRWPLIIVGLLTLHVGGMMTAVFIATHDRSFVVLPDYYKRALQWDENKALQLASDKLGWQRTVRLGQFDATSRTQPISVRLTDKDGAPLDDLKVSVHAAPELEPAHAQTVELRHDTDGQYVGSLNVPVFGSWQIDIDARKGDQTFVSTAKPWITN